MRTHRAWLGPILLAAFVSVAEVQAEDIQSEDAPLDRLIADLSDTGNAETRAGAAERLGTLGPAARDAVPALLEALAFDLDYPVRGRAAQALGRLGLVNDEVVPALTEALEWDQQLMVRWRAAEALEQIAIAHAGSADAILPALIATLRGDPYPGVRARAAAALGAIDPGPTEVVPVLVEAFRHDTHPGVRWQAAAALEGVALRCRDNGDTQAIPALTQALAALKDHAHPDVQRNAAGVRQAIRQLQSLQGPSVVN